MVLPSRETEPKTQPTRRRRRSDTRSCRLETRRVGWMRSTFSMISLTAAEYTRQVGPVCRMPMRLPLRKPPTENKTVSTSPMTCLEMAHRRTSSLNRPLQLRTSETIVDLAALDFDDLVNQPLGSDDVYFPSMIFHPSVHVGIIIRLRTPSAPQIRLSSNTSFDGYLWGNRRGFPHATRRLGGVDGETFAYLARSWIGRRIARAYCVDRRYRNALRRGLWRRCRILWRNNRQLQREQAEASVQAVSEHKCSFGFKADIDSVAAIFDLDYAGLIRTVETKSTKRPPSKRSQNTD